jgi:mono/diheme cytochrome c family protein
MIDPMKATLAFGLFLTLALAAVGAQSASGPTTLRLSKGADLVITRCSVCHGWASDYDSLMASGGIVAGKPGSSIVWTMISSGRMPRGGPAFTSKERKLVYDWIAAGAPRSPQ